MMLVQSRSFCISTSLLSHSDYEKRKHISSRNRRPHMIGSDKVGRHFLRSNARTSSTTTVVFPVTGPSYVCKLCSPNVELIDIIQNQVLIAAAVSAAIGQLSKPFTSKILYGNSFDFKNAFQAGGFPSTHSSAAVATATILGLERGFSDAIFGLAVVYAGLVMYDAQGVRREVGNHAKAFNRVLYRDKLDFLSSSKDASDIAEAFPGKSSSSIVTCEYPLLGILRSFQRRLPNASLLLKSDRRNTPLVKGESESIPFGFTPLKESVGHTEIEVIAGALLGFFVSIAVCTI